MPLPVEGEPQRLPENEPAHRGGNSSRPALARRLLLNPTRRLIGSLKQVTLMQYEAAWTERLQDINKRLAREIERQLRTEAMLRDALTQTQQELRYREVLIHEVNHRTKNALHLAIGLLSVQANRAPSDVIHGALETAINRIEQIDAVHTLLAYRTCPDVIGLSDYLLRLSQAIAASFAAGQVTMTVDLQPDVAWKPEIVMPLGLIVCEALTNSFKYAFPDGRDGQIRIRMHVERNGLMQLQIEDDGIGMPVERRIGALGLGLMERFAQRLKGEATFRDRSDNAGTVVVVTFPNPDAVDCAENATSTGSGFALLFLQPPSRAG